MVTRHSQSVIDYVNPRSIAQRTTRRWSLAHPGSQVCMTMCYVGDDRIVSARASMSKTCAALTAHARHYDVSEESGLSRVLLEVAS
eukprot:1158163-Pelagomonas_calceolata.AAC.12